MKLEYYILDPTKNITALVETPIDIGRQPAAALEIMKNEPSCEQVGFISMSDEGVLLRMAGGEFCGKASMSAAALWCSKMKLNSFDVSARVSGAADKLTVRIEKVSEGSYTGCVDMPKAVSAEEKILELDGKTVSVTAVDMAGIVHLVTEEKLEKAAAEKAVMQWCREMGADAMGLMQLCGDVLTPLVYVPDADTLFWESSCASGTTAVGAYLCRREGKAVRRGIIQPGGTLTVEARPDGEIKLSGSVVIVSHNSIDI